MNDCPATALPDARTRERARRTGDARFDGVFFIGVTSTGIFCRTTCAAPLANDAHVRFFATLAAAETAGLRPCRRCHPELAPGRRFHATDALVERALALITPVTPRDGLANHLARRLDADAGSLHKRFVLALGATPDAVHAARQLAFAKQLLRETNLPPARIAAACGFSSPRALATAFARINHAALRDGKRPRRAATDGITLQLPYRTPFDFTTLLAFLRGRALPGVEQVDDTSYARTLGMPEAPGWLRVRAAPRGVPALRLELHGVPDRALWHATSRVRQLFDLNADPLAVARTLAGDTALRPLVRRHPGLRLPGSWDGFEIALRAILGQQVSVAAARTLASRVVQRHGTPITTPVSGLDRLVPTAAALAQADLRALGVTTARANAIRGMAQALVDGRVSFDPAQSLDEFVARWTALPGIGDWTAQYIALRVFGNPDAFPAADLVLRRAAAGEGAPLSTTALTRRAEAWRPFRAYAVMQWWRTAWPAPSGDSA